MNILSQVLYSFPPESLKNITITGMRGFGKRMLIATNRGVYGIDKKGKAKKVKFDINKITDNNLCFMEEAATIPKGYFDNGK